MNRNSIENGLALIGALIVLVGVFSAAESALADDADATPPAREESAIASIAAARKANEEAARLAIRSAGRELQVDLDITLVDHKSTLIADGR